MSLALAKKVKTQVVIKHRRQAYQEKYEGNRASAIIEKEFANHPNRICANPAQNGQIKTEFFQIKTRMKSEIRGYTNGRNNHDET